MLMHALDCLDNENYELKADEEESFFIPDITSLSPRVELVVGRGVQVSWLDS